MTNPVFRIFDYHKAIEFYINWLGFKIDWEHNPGGAPIYMQVSLKDFTLHLSEHHGDCCPGSKVLVSFEGLTDYHKQLIENNYKYNKPGLEKTPWDENSIYVQVTDPFGNKIVFTEVLRKRTAKKQRSVEDNGELKVEN